ncbi:hypothetical protein B0O99DRAFT_595376 [Bisporella sp. PMI_857]|nr:hypothetical protein B0O99DRAFT_595376 [Bisporella sp. PMI_857]
MHSSSTWGTPTITRDFAILGGGAAGSYAAVRLRDLGRSIVVIEKDDHLSYIDYGPAKEFFARFNVSITSPTQTLVNTSYIDFTRGYPVTGYIPPTSSERTAALTKYLSILEQYEHILLPGYDKFPLPDQIPADLLLNFYDFAKKYGIEAAVPQIVAISGVGVGNATMTITLYVMQAFGAPMARALLNGALFVPSSHNNSELYGKIASFLTGDVLYSSKVVSAYRGSGSSKITLSVSSNDGHQTKVSAKRLLIAIPPTIDNLSALGLTDKERALFKKWTFSNTHAGIIQHPALSGKVALVNTPESAAPANYLISPSSPPYLGRLTPLGPGHRALVATRDTSTIADAQGVVQMTIDRMIGAGTLNGTAEEQVKFLAWKDHGPMHLRVGAEDLQKGFIQDLYALQGAKATWYTGAAFSGQYTSIVWAFTDVVIANLTYRSHLA